MRDQAAVASEQRASRLALNIDESGRENLVVRIDVLFGLRVRETARVGDAGDAVALDCQVSMKPRVTGAIDDSGVGDDQVVGLSGKRKAEQDGGESHKT